MICPFCTIDKTQYLAESKYAFAKMDGYPVSSGHVLIISKSHCSNYFDLTEIEQLDMMKLIGKVKSLLDKKYKTNDYNVGINCGKLAGQTVDHVHIHLIPRRNNDVIDPRGGVRWVIPEKAKYWDE